jgi:hypothetical protein
MAISASLMAGGGVIFASTNTGCVTFGAESLLTTMDFCFIFNCNGILGGTIDPCTGIGSGNSTVESENALPLFTDCPVE